tara:strand:- start:27 stop:488 length:462 start_codon:yes stop_codon:yes gene_type:complete
MGSVYKITDGVLNYYGSTQDPLRDRLTNHKSPTNKCSTNKMNRDNLTIELVEFVEIEQLKIRENWFIKNNECVNKHAAISSKEEKLAQHRARSKKYYEANKQKCYEANKRARDRPYSCPCGSNIKFGEKTRHHKSKKHINWLTLAPEFDVKLR